MPDHRPRRLGPGRFGQGPGHAEVGHAHPALLVEEEVGRLDVAVHQAPGSGHRPDPAPPRPPTARPASGSAGRPGRGGRGSEPPPRYSVTRYGPSVSSPQSNTAEDVGVVERGHRSGLGAEALQEGGRPRPTPGSSTLTATWRCKDTSSARKTCAEAPVPSAESSRYRVPRTRPMESEIWGIRAFPG